MGTREATTSRRPTRSAHALYLAECELHRRICVGDESAVLECLDRFGHLVYSVLRCKTGDVGRAEDLTEQAFVSLWRWPAAFDPVRGPMAFQLLRSLSSALDREPTVAGFPGGVSAG